jgi:MFS family permease
MRFFLVRAFSAANVANFCLYASMYGSVFFLAQYLQTALGYGPLDAGIRLLPLTATLMICAPITGALADRVGERWFLAGGLVMQAVGWGWLALIASSDLDYARMVPPLIVGGCGVSMAIPAVQKSALGAVAVEEIGKASGIVNTLRFLGGAFGVAIIAAVFARRGSFGSPQAFTDGFGPAIGGAAALALVGAAAGLGVPGRRRAAAAPVEATGVAEAGSRR